MLKLHELSPIRSGALRIWLDAQILDSLDDESLNDMSEDVRLRWPGSDVRAGQDRCK